MLHEQDSDVLKKETLSKGLVDSDVIRDVVDVELLILLVLILVVLPMVNDLRLRLGPRGGPQNGVIWFTFKGRVRIPDRRRAINSFPV